MPCSAALVASRGRRGLRDVVPVVLVVLSVVLSAALAGCAGPAAAVGPPQAAAVTSTSAGAATPAATTAVVTITEFVFGPDPLTVPAGATVTVDNRDGANHTVTAIDGSFDSGNIVAGGKGSFTAPRAPGRYPYKCAIHPTMTGMLVVA